ncbi:helix-turn-helix domain-containing protein [Vagococcus xieshaowenii]|uniref:XRE family transcriptional regulator n=1 Tax=Vagococcus xieshaowenii TaxID=2562451 RepID=A0AAJ5EEX0_9ENTE|nr:helix-turn-helix transcriptional regulator [Vagococcus xieshaowenii]QCA29342.1 XRE family transcriptional regulator [Vagococcus xieshaowenii]TFZ39366.1 XRE family transcriptional regulator [Vagococcus xieshaowenii]
MENFVYGTTLKKIRKELKLSQKDVSENICSQAMLSRIENNDVIPNVMIMQQLCSRLNKSVDEVLNHKTSHPNQQQAQAKELLELISYYHSTEQYTLLNKLIKDNQLLDYLTDDSQLQAYDYYKACLLSFYDPQSSQALKLFEKSLHYTYEKNNNLPLSDMEIMIMCEIATHHLNNNSFSQSLPYINQILKKFERPDIEHHRHELLRSLYNVCLALINHSQLELANSLIDCGITWAKEKHIYYYLDQLFLIKGIMKQDTHKINEAIELIKTMSHVRTIASPQP